MLNSAGSKMFNLSIYNVCGKTKGIKLSIFPVSLGCTCGTAKLMEEETRVFTFSMHGATNYPFHKEKSDLDIGLKDGTTGQTYLSILGDILPKLIHEVKPDFAFYLSGVDILNTDKFGKLQVSLDECKLRDEMVLGLLKKNNIPVAVVRGGGDAPDVKTIVEAHCNTFRLAVELFE